MLKKKNTNIKKYKFKTIYFWACDYKNNTGEGRLARLYLAKISKEKR